VVSLVELLDKSDGTAAVAPMAESLRFGKFRIQGVIAEVQEQLNIEQHEVLRFDRSARCAWTSGSCANFRALTTVRLARP
jgi:hypothetical protein